MHTSLISNSKLEQLRDRHSNELDAIPDLDHRDTRLVELNVLEQMREIQEYSKVYRAAEQGALQIHGLVYDRNEHKAVQLIPLEGSP